jgi:hypothetical protein
LARSLAIQIGAATRIFVGSKAGDLSGTLRACAVIVSLVSGVVQNGAMRCAYCALPC